MIRMLFNLFFPKFSMVNVVKLLDKRDSNKKYSLRKGETTLGRGRANHIVYQPAGYTTLSGSSSVDERKTETGTYESNLISRAHCTFYLDRELSDESNSGLIVEDHSKNGVYVNGLLVGNGMTAKLKEGDKVKIGHRVLEVIVEPSVLTQIGSSILRGSKSMLDRLTSGPKTIYDI
jgi:pSer/pThr/pTyr-binding forkhead associated (FHA) protein